MSHWFLLPAFFCIAVLYSSVGFGGGSSYLAILAICDIGFPNLRAIALLCNITVVLGGTYIFFRNGHLRLRKTAPLIAASIPLAFFGGRFHLSEDAFFLLLGVVLVSAAVLLWIQREDRVPPANVSAKFGEEVNEQPNPSPTMAQLRIALMTGGVIGLLSGVVGIGGGIFLSPTLNLMRWDRAKVVSATASLFILVNSIAGLLGQASTSEFKLNWRLALALVVCVFLGGQIGSRLGARILPPKVIRRMTALLVLVVGVRQLLRWIDLS